MKLYQPHLWYITFITLSLFSYQAPPLLHIKQDAIKAFHEQYTQRLQKHYRWRMAYKGGLLVAFMGTFFKDWGNVSDLKQKLSCVTDQLHALQAPSASITNQSIAADATRIAMIFQGIKKSIVATVATTWSLAKYMTILIATQKLVNSLFTPLVSPLFTTITLTAADSWFLAEQVSHSNVTFVVVHEEIQFFITLLKRIEATIDQLPLINQTKDPLQRRHTLLSLMRITEELIGYIYALAYHVPADEKASYRTLLETIHPLIVQSAETLSQETEDIATACAIAKTHLRTLLRPLQYVTPYHILSWPFSVACQELFQSFMTTYFAAHVQPAPRL